MKEVGIMSRGVLILAHGSRRKSTERTLDAIAGMVKERLGDVTLETAYMEFGERNIESGLNSLVTAGASDIAVVPYFLFDGVHIHEDIPQELDKFREKNPQVKITMGRTLGADERLAEILADRVRELDE